MLKEALKEMGFNTQKLEDYTHIKSKPIQEIVQRKLAEIEKELQPFLVIYKELKPQVWANYKILFPGNVLAEQQMLQKAKIQVRPKVKNLLKELYAEVHNAFKNSSKENPV